MQNFIRKKDEMQNFIRKKQMQFYQKKIKCKILSEKDQMQNFIRKISNAKFYQKKEQMQKFIRKNMKCKILSEKRTNAKLSNLSCIQQYRVLHWKITDVTSCEKFSTIGNKTDEICNVVIGISIDDGLSRNNQRLSSKYSRKIFSNK